MKTPCGWRISVWLLAAVVLNGSLVAGAQAEPRTAKVAGAFYPAESEVLYTTVSQLLHQHAGVVTSAAPKPRLLIVPHAGYPYSGVVAARAFREVQSRTYDGVVVVGFTHQDQFEGASVDDRESYHTPLGSIPVDVETAAWLQRQPGLSHVERAHDSSEHSLEVELPFLQVALGRFKLVPVLMGETTYASAEHLAQALAELAKRGDYLFVFSTDLSHYHPYDEAVQRDTTTVNALLFETSQAVDRVFRYGALEACGRGPIVTALRLAELLGYPERRLLLYANSGDTTGDKTRVVGYAAIGFYDRSSSARSALVSDEAGRALVRAARLALQAQLRPGESTPPLSLETYPDLAKPHGLFVTLTKRGQLRGCMGRVQSDAPLKQLLPEIALESALQDPRFAPLTADELPEVTIEVSVLTVPQAIAGLQEIVPGRDGVILQKDGHGGVFLPQVWQETGWTSLEFLSELAHQKAGLPADAWKTATLLTFQDQAFGESVETAH